jgi:2-oxoglutarate dehydrogenase E2 component (dihydrolipoamide succinyltransferase)
MAIVEVKVPQLSESVAEATLLQWKKKPGEAVAMDEILIEIETDKVVLEVPAPAAGVLAELVVADGGTVVSDQLIAASTPKARPAPLRPPPPGPAPLPCPAPLQPPLRPPARPAWPCPPPPS